MREADQRTAPSSEQEMLLLAQFHQRMVNTGFPFSHRQLNDNSRALVAYLRHAVFDYGSQTPFNSSRQMAKHAWIRSIRSNPNGRIVVVMSFRNRFGTPLAPVTNCLESYSTLYRMPGPALLECCADVSTWKAGLTPLRYGRVLLSEDVLHKEIERMHRPGDSWLRHYLADSLINHRRFRKIRQPEDVVVRFIGAEDSLYEFSVRLSGVPFPVFARFSQGQLNLSYSKPEGKKDDPNKSGQK